MLNEKTDLLDRIMWIVLCEQMGGYTVETAINVSKEAKEQGLWEICKSYLMEELRESARLMASQMVGVNHEAEEKDDYPKPTQPVKHTGCMFGDILK